MYKYNSYNCFLWRGEVLQKECKNKNKLTKGGTFKKLNKIKIQKGD